MKKRPPKGRQIGKAVSPKQKEQMLQLYAVEGNFTEVARLMGLSTTCVTRHIKKMLANPDPEAAVAQKRVLRELQGKVTTKTNKILDAIGPDDTESGKIEVRNDRGELVRVINWGPSLMQKVTAAAILIDKAKVLADVTAALSEGVQEGDALVPAPESLLRSIVGKVKSLKILDVRFQEDHPDLAQKAQAALELAQVVEPENVLTVEDFDGNVEG